MAKSEQSVSLLKSRYLYTLYFKSIYLYLHKMQYYVLLSSITFFTCLCTISVFKLNVIYSLMHLVGVIA